MDANNREDYEHIREVSLHIGYLGLAQPRQVRSSSVVKMNDTCFHCDLDESSFEVSDMYFVERIVGGCQYVGIRPEILISLVGIKAYGNRVSFPDVENVGSRGIGIGTSQ
ncbi:hypothetical protein IOD16_27170 [Saccharothrix sp. 6-C]|nr:hypothetical protein IOD16_27170 [Saccharothrix sp. 6-C]